MTDIRIPLGGLKFSVRVSIICIRDGSLLVNTVEGHDFAFLPGGALGTGEDALECARREWAEETGTAAGALRLVGVVENFFGPPGSGQHELGLVTRMAQAPADLPRDAFPVRDAESAFFRWLPLGDVTAYPVLPLAVGGLLDVPEGSVRHLLERD